MPRPERFAAWNQTKSYLRDLATAGMRPLAKALGHDLVRRSVYSPVPTVPEPGNPAWTMQASLIGLRNEPEEQFSRLAGPLATGFVDWARLLAEPPPRFPFDPKNPYFSGSDAACLFAIVRHQRPRQVIEIGAGHTTRIISFAGELNRREGHPCQVLSVDPKPLSGPLGQLPGVQFRAAEATEVALAEYTRLETGDLLFIDSSHTVKRGSEVNFLVLEVLPRLRPGVLVHFHDIFLPGDYPREWFARGTFLAEQYLVHAFLLGNRDWEVQLALQALFRADANRLADLTRTPEIQTLCCSSLWLRRTDEKPTSSPATP